MAKKYHTIVWLQDYQDETFCRYLEDHDADAMALYMSQWDMGEYHDEPLVLGNPQILRTYDVTKHDIPGAGEYTLMTNYGLGEATLLIESLT